MGVLTLIDRNALTRYCATWGEWKKLGEWIAEHGTVYPLKDKDGQPTGVVTWPQVKTALQMAEQLGRLEREFGMTPAARATLKVTPPKPVERDRKQRFLCLPGERVDA